MLRTRIRSGVLIAGGAVAALLLAGCNGNGAANSANTGVPTIPESTSSSGQPLPTTNQPPTTAAQEQPQEQPATAGGECKVADLNVSLSQGEGAAGTYYRGLIFTNKGGRTCTMQGFPGVSFVAGDDGHQVGPAAYRNGVKGPVVTLKPGDTAYSEVGFVQVANYDPAVCRPTEVRGLRIYPPHDYDSMFLANPGTGCAGSPPGNQLTVSTVKAGMPAT
jgi:hypothetical protein